MVFEDGLIYFAAVAVAYLVGAFPTAYVITRLAAGKDIRVLGSGNMGANNTWREVGPAAGISVGLLDVGKGIAAVFLAHWLLDVPLFQPNPVVLLAGVAAVAGHIWPVYLRFAGGNGLLTSVGALIMELPWEMLIVLGVLLMLIAATRTFVLSMNLSLFSVPVSAWLLEGELLYVGFWGALAVMMACHFRPTAREAEMGAGGKANLLAGLLRRTRR